MKWESWEVKYVDPSIFLGKTMKAVSDLFRKNQPVLVVFRIKELSWSVVHLYAPYDWGFNQIQIYPCFYDALRDWNRELVIKKINRKFSSYIKSIGIKKKGFDLRYFGTMTQIGSEFSPGWEKTVPWYMADKIKILSCPVGCEDSVVSYFQEQVSCFSESSFFMSPERNSEPIVDFWGMIRGEKFCDGLFVDDISILSESIDRQCIHKNKLIVEMDKAIDFFNKNHCLEKPLSSFAKRGMLSVDLYSQANVVAYNANTLGLVDSRCEAIKQVDKVYYLKRCKLVRMLCDPIFYKSIYYKMSISKYHKNLIDTDVIEEVRAYMEEVVEKYPVISKNPISNRIPV